MVEVELEKHGFIVEGEIYSKVFVTRARNLERVVMLNQQWSSFGETPEIY